MSVFHTETINCPACTTPVQFKLVYSVNADRRPDLRDAIVAGTFQREPCPSCARQAGIDDRTLELAKVMALRHGSETPVPGKRELRLVEAGAEDFVLAWVRPADSRVESAMRVPRSLIAEIDAEPEPWKAMRDQVGEGLVVDFQREMLAAA
jgi:hypothetical protein